MIPKNLKIISASKDAWPSMACIALNKAIHESIAANSICNLMLTGGNTAKRLYEEWNLLSLFPFDKIHFFFGDERCVSPQNDDSNFSLVMKSLFSEKVSSILRISRMEGENLNRDMAAINYELLLPDEIDILMLGVGLDGHIASLFPGHHALREFERSVLAVTELGLEHDRITITPKVIRKAKNIFLLATGSEKGRLLARALTSKLTAEALPIKLTFGGTWLLDEDARREITNLL